MSGEFPLKPEGYKGSRAMITGLVARQTELRDEKGRWFEYEAVGQAFTLEIEDQFGFVEEIRSCPGSPLLSFLFGDNWQNELDKHLDPSDF